MNILNWNHISSQAISPFQTRQVIHTPGSTIVRLVSLKGALVPLHHHVHEQVTMLESGAFRFVMQGETVVLRPGDVLRIASDVPHEAEALEDSVTVEVFVPAREDWIGEGQSLLADSIQSVDGN
jgi:quercetin dioxygenase-like cupin family protein